MASTYTYNEIATKLALSSTLVAGKKASAARSDGIPEEQLSNDTALVRPECFENSKV